MGFSWLALGEFAFPSEELPAFAEHYPPCQTTPGGFRAGERLYDLRYHHDVVDCRLVFDQSEWGELQPTLVMMARRAARLGGVGAIDLLVLEGDAEARRLVVRSGRVDERPLSPAEEGRVRESEPFAEASARLEELRGIEIDVDAVFAEIGWFPGTGPFEASADQLGRPAAATPLVWQDDWDLSTALRATSAALTRSEAYSATLRAVDTAIVRLRGSAADDPQRYRLVLARALWTAAWVRSRTDTDPGGCSSVAYEAIAEYQRLAADDPAAPGRDLITLQATMNDILAWCD